MKTVNLCGVEIAVVSRDSFADFVIDRLKGSGGCAVCKVNTEFLARSISDKAFQKALNDSALNIADGRGVLWAARYLTISSKPLATSYKLLRAAEAVWQMIYSGAAVVFNPKYISGPISENIPGVDALKLMLKAAEETRSGVFFFGATQTDLDGAIGNIQKEMPKLIVDGSLNGYDFQNDKSIDPVDIINKTDAKLLIVALGSPMQEYWVRDNLPNLKNVRVAVGEGGSLAFLSGTFKRAPKWVQEAGLEWLWRLFMNKSLTHQTGSRLQRVWNAVPIFIYEVVKWKIKNGAIDVEDN